MSDKDNGGPAFPTGKCVGDTWVQEGGMTMHDYYAAHAPITFADAHAQWYADPDREPCTKPTVGDVMKHLAAMRIVYADAMLKEREK